MDPLRRIFLALLVASFGAFSAVAFAACGKDDSADQVELSLTEHDLSPGRVEVRPGEIEFVVKNDGRRLHAFAVDTPDGIERTKDIKPGETARVTVDLSTGRYRMYDPRGDYRARGVRGTVIVTSDHAATVTERTVTERTVEQDTVKTPEPDQPPVTVTQPQVQPSPRPRRRLPRPTPAPAPPPPVTETVPVPPSPPDNP